MLLWLLTLSGCLWQNGVTASPDPSPRGAPTVLESAEDVLNTLDRGLQALDERMENALY